MASVLAFAVVRNASHASTCYFLVFSSTICDQESESLNYDVDAPQKTMQDNTKRQKQKVTRVHILDRRGVFTLKKSQNENWTHYMMPL